MNQIGFNLVAIGIFSVTFFSLLGPWLHISPAVPAVTTFAALGLLTLDTLTWQGKGRTLVLDWFAQQDDNHRQRVLHHEAGHFLVAYLLGIPVTGYTLTAWDALQQRQAGQGGVSFDCQDLDAELQQGTLSARLVDRYCTVWMAGVAAETLVYGGAEGGADDRQKFQALWQQLQRPFVECQQKQRWSALQAQELLQDHQPAYDALVKAMGQKSEVSVCLQAIQQHMVKDPI